MVKMFKGERGGGGVGGTGSQSKFGRKLCHGPCIQRFH